LAASGVPAAAQIPTGLLDGANPPAHNEVTEIVTGLLDGAGHIADVFGALQAAEALAAVFHIFGDPNQDVLDALKRLDGKIGQVASSITFFIAERDRKRAPGELRAVLLTTRDHIANGGTLGPSDWLGIDRDAAKTIEDASIDANFWRYYNANDTNGGDVARTSTWESIIHYTQADLQYATSTTAILSMIGCSGSRWSRS
jgi:hypothetical protein